MKRPVTAQFKKGQIAAIGWAMRKVQNARTAAQHNEWGADELFAYIQTSLDNQLILERNELEQIYNGKYDTEREDIALAT